MGGDDNDRLRREIMVRQQLANDTMLLIKRKTDNSRFVKYAKMARKGRREVAKHEWNYERSNDDIASLEEEISHKIP